MSNTAPQPDTQEVTPNPTELVLGFVSTMTVEGSDSLEKAKEFVNQMVTFSFDYLDEDKRAARYKQDVTKLMSLAVKIRHAEITDYDAAYKRLEQELYSFLSSTK